MKTGKVRSVLGKKNYGFISSGARSDFFFHREDFNGHWDDLVNDFENDLEITVEFEESRGPKGPRATDVTRLDIGLGG